MATLHFVAGKAGAGKTTRARRLAIATPAVLICEDVWLAALAEPIRTLHEYAVAVAMGDVARSRPALVSSEAAARYSYTSRVGDRARRTTAVTATRA